MNGKIALLALIGIVAISLSLVTPAMAWTYVDGTEDTLYEKFGPRLDRIYISQWASEDAEWDQMEVGAIDITDWPLSKERYDRWTTESPHKENMLTMSYGPELGYYLVDINNDGSPEKAFPDPDPTVIDEPNPALPNPCADTAFRHALWHCMDRDYVISSICLGMGYPMYTPIPLAMPEYVDHEIMPGGALEELTHPFDTAEAASILDEAGYVDADGDGWRDMPDGTPFILKFNIRADHALRRDMGLWYAGVLESIGINVDERVLDRRTCFYETMVDKNFHLYTGGWSLGRDPDHVVLYQSYYYWHPGFCYNYDRVNCSAFDEAADHLVMPNTVEEAKEWAIKAQRIFNNESYPGALGALFVWSAAGYKSIWRTYTGGNPTSPAPGEEAYTGNNWTGIVNVMSYGPDSGYTFLNAHPEGFFRGDGEHMTMRYGFKTLTMEKPSNPVYAEWVWDWAVLGLSYDSLIARDPYTFDYIPWLCESFEGFTWVDPEDGETKSGVRFALRNDVYWSDGVPLTAADVVYTLFEMPDALEAAGLTPPWWYSSIVYVKSYYLIDQYNLEMLLDVKSIWAIGWIGGSIVLPKHVWKPLLEQYVETGEPDFYGPYVDPNVIATGPYRFVEYVANDHTILVANKPGSTVTTAWPGSTAVTSPGYWRYYPCYIHVDLPGKFDAGSRTFNVAVDDLCVTEDMTATITVSIDGTPVGTFADVSIPAGTTYTAPVTYDFSYDKHVIEVAVDWAISSESGTKTYTHYCTTTIKEDISGSTFYDDIGLPDYPYKDQLPTPDCKVRVDDVLAAALSFGSNPGHPRWNSIADITGDYKVRVDDILAIALKFGFG